MKPHTTMGKETATTAPHALLVSFPGQGHINPVLRFAKRLASKGLLVTFSSTVDIGQRICASTETTPGTLNPVGEGHLRFEFFSNGWDEDGDDDPSRRGDIDALLAQLSTVGSVRFAELVRRQAEEGRPVACVIGNPFMPWVLDVAGELNIPSAVLWVQSLAVFSIYYHYFHSTVDFPADYGSDDVVSVDLPGLPALKVDDLPSFLLESNPYKTLASVILSQFDNINKAAWVFANSFEELEHDALEAISKLSPVVPIGPLVETGVSGVIKGDIWKAEDCMEWLDRQQPRSVVYASVGSVVVLGRDEMAEMAYGLRDSGRAFLWVVREDCRHQLPEGFTEDVKGRGMVVAWSPQDEVLAHRAIACFVTHCGWNSTLELLTAGVPVIAYPQWGDQLTDAKFLVDVYKVGTRLKAPVERGEFAKRVGEVTEGEKAEEVRGRCLALKEAAARAVAEGGSSDRNIQAFVDDIRRRVCGSKLEHDQHGKRL
ncbi:limonoid UDP-glucosyltransferase isoform X1 [Iris pallida]|uniref:Glycosyltransferase n=1 Tax=Iris pallida TaxID=29817 RepID=A0AAX6H0R3_IRIPA|nr:limonoid UDP-glucosyltransferase isoform X1 [Iris pallida]